jgi:hypothetical protein
MAYFVHVGFLCDDLQQCAMDDGKKELDVDVEDEDDVVDDVVTNYAGDDEEHEDKDDVDAIDDNKDDALDVAKLDGVPK